MKKQGLQLLCQILEEDPRSMSSDTCFKSMKKQGFQLHYQILEEDERSMSPVSDPVS
jgi:hypothetical protein